MLKYKNNWNLKIIKNNQQKDIGTKPSKHKTEQLQILIRTLASDPFQTVGFSKRAGLKIQIASASRSPFTLSHTKTNTHREKGIERREIDKEISLKYRGLDLTVEPRAILSPFSDSSRRRKQKMSGRHEKEKGVNVQVLLRCR
jgi:hypothetical protein